MSTPAETAEKFRAQAKELMASAAKLKDELAVIDDAARRYLEAADVLDGAVPPQPPSSPPVDVDRWEPIADSQGPKLSEDERRRLKTIATAASPEVEDLLVLIAKITGWTW